MNLLSVMLLIGVPDPPPVVPDPPPVVLEFVPDPPPVAVQIARQIWYVVGSVSGCVGST